MVAPIPPGEDLGKRVQASSTLLMSRFQLASPGQSLRAQTTNHVGSPRACPNCKHPFKYRLDFEAADLLRSKGRFERYQCVRHATYVVGPSK